MCSVQAETAGVKVELVDNSFLKLRGEIKGPPDTPFDGGKYILDITIPETYPFNPPKVSLSVCFEMSYRVKFPLM